MSKPNPANQPGRFQLPADLTSLTVEQLGELRAAAEAEFDGIYGADGGARADQLARANELIEAIEKIQSRSEALAADAADTQAKFDALAARRRPTAETESPAGDGQGDNEQGGTTAPTPEEPAQAGQLVPVGGATTASRELGGLAGGKQLNPSLAGIRTAGPTQTPPAPPLAITASVGLPGAFEPGARINDLRQLGDLVEDRARGMGDAGKGTNRYMPRRGSESYGGVQIASIARQWRDGQFSDAGGIAEIEEYRTRIAAKRRPDAFSALVAAGGWCAMGEPIWDFFNVTCQGGMIDLPTRGINRGGIIVPTSPTVADAYTPNLGLYGAAFSNATVPWLWTEADDILTVTGSTNKPCLRVPCAGMTNYRLECYGVCITAGNLADNAWPESTANFLQLINNVHYHASNARYISQISTLAGAAIFASVGCTGGGRGAAAPLLGVAEIAAVDTRTRYGACPDDVMEWVLPTWAKTSVRIDLSKRMGISDFMCVTDAMIAAWFNCRNIRVQFVEDWQVRAAGQPGSSTPIQTLPTSVQGLMYFPGAIVRGNGMSLNLGVVRDSTLNAENDHTALWMEECHLIAQFGPAPRLYQIELCPDGTVGAADLTSCCP
jgi:hypothetical protein